MRKNKVTVLMLGFATYSCNSQDVSKDADCGGREQQLFMACLSAGCSATYRDALSGSDDCSLEGGGSIVSVEAGGECGFTSSGSCYVFCDCPDGIGFTYDTEEGDLSTTDQGNSPNDDAAGEGGSDVEDTAPESDGGGTGSVDSASDGGGGSDADGAGSTVDTADDGGADGAVVSDADSDGYTVDEGDCDDSRSAINPAATDIAGDSIDQNCDGVDGTDIDRDGFASSTSGGTDCNDFDAVINPDYGMFDLTDFVDSNCDGLDGLHYDYKSVYIEASAVRGKGDFDGDGLTDLILSDDSLTMYLVLGSTIQADSDRHISYADSWVDFNFSLSATSVGDLDSDGKDDVNFGEYTFFGSTIMSARSLTIGINHDIYVYSTHPSCRGVSSLIIPDATGDGIYDLRTEYCSGAVELFPGGTISGSIDVAVRWTPYDPGHQSSSLVLIDADSDSDGLFDFYARCYTGSGFYYYYGYRDANDETSFCHSSASDFIPNRRIGDIDGDGIQEYSGGGSCIKSANNLTTDQYSCDFDTDPYNSYFMDLDGSGSIDFVSHSSTSVLVLDFLGSHDEIEIPGFHMIPDDEFNSLYNYNFDYDPQHEILLNVSGGHFRILGVD